MKLRQPGYSNVSLTKFIRALFSKETPKYIKGIIGLAVAYTIFPIDFLPDILGVVGLVDDVAVIGVLTTVAMTLLDNYNNQNLNPSTRKAAENVEETDNL